MVNAPRNKARQSGRLRRRCAVRYAAFPLLLVLAVGAFSPAIRASEAMIVTSVKMLEVSEAKDYGIEISVEWSRDTAHVRFKVSDEFPCDLESVGVATFDGWQAILATTIRPDNGIYLIQVSTKSIGKTRMDFECIGLSKENYATYHVNLTELTPGA